MIRSDAAQRVRMRILSRMTDPQGECHEIRNARSGLLRCEAGEFVIEYDDEQDGERARIELRFSNGRAQMTRSGMTRSQLRFLPGERTSGAYVTMYGEIPVAVDTRRVELMRTEQGGTLWLDYDVYVSGERTAATVLDVTWRL